MKIKTLSLIALLIVFFSCNTKTKTTEIKTVDVAQLLGIIASYVDNELYITGTVNHVCSHSGRRCFLTDPTGEKSIKIEATGDIESFSQELMGSELKVRGIIGKTN